MMILLNILSVGCSIVGLVCFVMVIMQMFKREDTTMGIVCLVTLLLCGVGYLIAFVYGWTKATAWDIKKVMIAWTLVFVLNFALTGIGFALALGNVAATAGSGDFNFDPESMNVDIDMEGGELGVEGFEFDMPEAGGEAAPE